MTKVRSEQLKGVAKQFPAFFRKITPNFSLPNTQIEITIEGEFFTPDTLISSSGFTVNVFEFIDTRTVKLLVTTGATDNNYAVSINNQSGTVTNTSGVFTISIGNVIIPQSAADWTPISAASTLKMNTPGELLMNDNFSAPKARWKQTIDTTRKFRIVFSPKISPFFSSISSIPRGDTNLGHYVKLINKTTGVEIGGLGFWVGVLRSFGAWGSSAFSSLNLTGSFSGSLENEVANIFTFEWDLVNFKYINNSNVVASTLNNPSLISAASQIELEFKLWQIDIDSIKYIELP